MGKIDAAKDHLIDHKKQKYAAVAKQFNMHDTTLRRRFLGESVSRQQAASDHSQLLNKTQEDVLLGYIDSLTDKHIPLTTQIVRNLGKELL